MKPNPAILCPIDFSDASLVALRYGRLVAEHVATRLVILAVEDPLLTEAIELGTGMSWSADDTRQELARFAGRVLDSPPTIQSSVEYEVAVGKPANQILTLAREKNCDLIVMSTHGLTGMRKLFFGSTTERVLRETTMPVLAISGSEPVASLEDVRRVVGRILVPVDLSPTSLHQIQIASGLAEALQVPLIVTHVVEPVRSPLAAKLHLPSIELERRARAEDALADLLANVPGQLQREALVVFGDPAEEIAKIARDRRAGLIVIGLQGSPLLGPHMGSVTYRVLCLSSALALALPPPQPASLPA